MERIAVGIEGIQKSLNKILTSQGLSQNLPAVNPIEEMDFGNQLSDIDNFDPHPKSVDNELYPYQVFMKDKYPNLDEDDKRHFNKLLEQSDGLEPLAYYFYKTQKKAPKTMNDYKRMFMEFTKAG